MKGLVVSSLRGSMKLFEHCTKRSGRLVIPQKADALIALVVILILPAFDVTRHEFVAPSSKHEQCDHWRSRGPCVGKMAT